MVDLGSKADLLINPYTYCFYYSMITTITLLTIITIINIVSAQCSDDRMAQSGWFRTSLRCQNYRSSEALWWQKVKQVKQITWDSLSSIPSHCCLYNPNSISSKPSQRSFHSQEIKCLIDKLILDFPPRNKKEILPFF